MFVHNDYWIVNPTNRERRIIGKAMSRLNQGPESIHMDMNYVPMIVLGLALATTGSVIMLIDLPIMLAYPLTFVAILLSLLALTYFCYGSLIHRRMAQERMNRMLLKSLHNGHAYHMKSADNQSIDNLFDVLVTIARDKISLDTQIRHLFNLYPDDVNSFLSSRLYYRAQERINSGKSTMAKDQAARLGVIAGEVVDEIIQANQDELARERSFDEGLVRDINHELT